MLFRVRKGNFSSIMYITSIFIQKLFSKCHKFLFFLCFYLLERPMLLYFYDKHNFYRLLPIITLTNTLNDKIKYKWNLTFQLLIELRPCPCLLERKVLLYFHDKNNFYRLLPIITLANTLNDKIKYKLNLKLVFLIDLRPCPCLLERLIDLRKTT